MPANNLSQWRFTLLPGDRVLVLHTPTLLHRMTAGKGRNTAERLAAIEEIQSELKQVPHPLLRKSSGRWVVIKARTTKATNPILVRQLNEAARVYVALLNRKRANA